jgi:hypothetical protein
MIRGMKKYAKANGLEVHKEISADAYVEDFCSAYATHVSMLLREMRKDTEAGTESMALAIRDITVLAREMMWDDFEQLRPHEADCDCDKCHPLKCNDPKCQRAVCVERRKPVKTRGRGRQYYRNENVAGSRAGWKSGGEAKISGKGGERDISRSKRKEIE